MELPTELMTVGPTTASNFTASNRTFLDSEFRYKLFPACYSIIFILGLLSNGYVLFVLRRFRSAHSMNEIRIYMTNLTVADLLFVCALPFWIAYYSNHGDWRFSDFICRLTGSLFFINTYGSVFFLGVISVNRYMAITRPLDKASSDSWRRGVAVTTVIWAVTLAMSLPYLISTGVHEDEGGVTRCFEGFHDENDGEKRAVAATHFLIIAAFFLVFLLVVLCNLLIARALLAKSPSQARSGTIAATRASGKSKAPTSRPTEVKRNALQMLCAVVGVFVLCFLPHHIVQGPWTLAVLEIGQGWGSTAWGPETRQALNDAHQITLLLMGLNCILDPIVYCFATRKFRKFIVAHLMRIGKGDGCSHTASTQVLSMDSRNQSVRLQCENPPIPAEELRKRERERVLNVSESQDRL
ncbi:platelet-activating factor receptor [Aplochiton taeniatus]